MPRDDGDPTEYEREKQSLIARSERRQTRWMWPVALGSLALALLGAVCVLLSTSWNHGAAHAVLAAGDGIVAFLVTVVGARIPVLGAFAAALPLGARLPLFHRTADRSERLITFLDLTAGLALVANIAVIAWMWLST